MQLQNQNILVTGGASGMGLATSHYFQSQGANVIALDINQQALDTLKNQHKDITIVQADITSAEQLEEAFVQLKKQNKSPRAVIHCAGIVDGARAVGRDGPQALDRFQNVIDINLTGTFNILRLSAAAMMEQDELTQDGERGVIIMTASVAAFDGQIGQLAYSASKGGVAAMTLPAAREFGKFGIRVMTIAPGIIKTPMMASLSDEVEKSLCQQLPFPKRLGEAEEYARLAQHILENPYLNGEVIRLDASLRMAAK
jgi:NAD(P)-dependent dehydrogenase (short-subunit alcohol dehydrogenase family)